MKLDPNFFEALARTEDFGSRLSLVLDLMSSGGRVADSALRKQRAPPHHHLLCTMHNVYYCPTQKKPRTEEATNMWLLTKTLTRGRWRI